MKTEGDKNMVNAVIKDAIVRNGVKNLKEYGYPDVTVKNIMSDQIYSQFFKSMLNDNLGKGSDEEINALLEELARLPQTT